MTTVPTATPPSITRLDLSNNVFDGMPTEEVIDALNSLPHTVACLDLINSRFQKRTSDEVAKIFAAIPASVTELRLDGICFCCKTITELAKRLATIPACLTRLYLTGNRLFCATVPEIAKVLAHIPENIREITLAISDIENRSEEELITLGQALPFVIKVHAIGPSISPVVVDHPKLNLLNAHVGRKLAVVNDALTGILPTELIALILDSPPADLRAFNARSPLENYSLFSSPFSASSPALPSTVVHEGLLSRFVHLVWHGLEAILSLIVNFFRGLITAAQEIITNQNEQDYRFGMS